MTDWRYAEVLSHRINEAGREFIFKAGEIVLIKDHPDYPKYFIVKRSLDEVIDPNSGGWYGYRFRILSPLELLALEAE